MWIALIVNVVEGAVVIGPVIPALALLSVYTEHGYSRHGHQECVPGYPT
jgi:hypothetical protein